MFVTSRTKKAVQEFLARPDVGEFLDSPGFEKILREAASKAKKFAEERREASEISAQLASQRVSN
jgi:hypothetical protein